MATIQVAADHESHQPKYAASNQDLRRFHEKYENDEAAPVSRQAAPVARNKQQRMRRARELMAKRQRLRELQEWEYQVQITQRRVANPGPVGLLGFGMTTILLNLHNTGHFPLTTVISAMGICYGGGAQFIAGLLEWVRGNTFAYVAFLSYGAFWLSLVCVWMLPNASFFPLSEVQASSEYFVGAYLSLWGIFSFFMMICTLRMNVAIFLVFLTVTLLFLLLAGGNMAGNPTAIRAAGYEGIVCGCIALYLGVAEVLNEVWDRTILPVIPMTQLLGWFGADKSKSPAHSEIEHEPTSKGQESD